MINLKNVLRQFPNILFKQPFSFRNHTTVRIGGLAPIALYPRTRDELVSVVAFLQRHFVPYLLLGFGSNVLVSDRGYNGVVICTKYVNQVHVSKNEIDADCGAGVGKILKIAAIYGIADVSFLAGIPASFGGILYMNAGAQSKYISDIICSVDTVRDGNRLTVPVSDCLYSYKSSRFMQTNEVILGGLIRGNLVGSDEVENAVRKVLQARRLLPKGYSLGCVFKNPDSAVSAGSLIERCGLKGYQYGDVAVSKQHANFIINSGNGTAEQYRCLVRAVQKRVFDQTGILLREEIRYIGEF